MTTAADQSPRQASLRTKTSECARLDIKVIPTRRLKTMKMADGGGAILRTGVRSIRVVRADPIAIIDITLEFSAGPAGGTQTFFLCPISGSRCRTLYVDAERAGTAKALGLAYASQSQSSYRRTVNMRDRCLAALDNPRMGAKRRQTLLEKVRAADRILNETDAGDWRVGIAIEDQSRLLRTPRVRLREKGLDPLSSRAALLEGRRVPDRPRSAEIKRTLGALARLRMPMAKPPVIPSVRLRPSAEFPFIDIRDFPAGQGHADAHYLVWRDGPEGDYNVRAWLDGAGGRFVLSVEPVQGPRFVQMVEIAGGRRPADRFLVCPVTGRKHLRLYLRSKFFAGRAVHDLMTATEWERWPGGKNT